MLITITFAVKLERMKTSRTVNTMKINEWLAFRNTRHPRLDLASQAGVSLSLINQVLLGKCPGLVSQLRICKVLCLEQDEIFPVFVDQKDSASA